MYTLIQNIETEQIGFNRFSKHWDFGTAFGTNFAKWDCSRNVKAKKQAARGGLS